MLSPINILKWKLILLCALTAFVSSVITVTIIKASESAPLECPAVEDSSNRSPETFLQRRPRNSPAKEF